MGIGDRVAQAAVRTYLRSARGAGTAPAIAERLTTTVGLAGPFPSLDTVHDARLVLERVAERSARPRRVFLPTHF